MFIDRDTMKSLRSSERRNDTRMNTCQVEFRRSELRRRWGWVQCYKHLTPTG